MSDKFTGSAFINCTCIKPIAEILEICLLDYFHVGLGEKRRCNILLFLVSHWHIAPCDKVATNISLVVVLNDPSLTMNTLGFIFILTNIYTINNKPCKGRFSAGTCGSSCNYATGLWRTKVCTAFLLPTRPKSCLTITQKECHIPSMSLYEPL